MAKAAVKKSKIGDVVQRNNMARSHNHCCHVKAKMCSLFVVVELYVPVNDIKKLNFAMEMQEWVPFALLSLYKIFRTAVNSINILTSSCKVLGVFVRF
jgi:hypothetical protein